MTGAVDGAPNALHGFEGKGGEILLLRIDHFRRTGPEEAAKQIEAVVDSADRPCTSAGSGAVVLCWRKASCDPLNRKAAGLFLDS